MDARLADSVVPGSAVSVQFGARKIVGGIVWRVHSEVPHYKNIKPVISLLFPEPLVDDVQMRLWEWIAEYYMCTLGEVMRAALPAMLKPSGFSEEEFAADEFKVRTVRMVALSPDISGEEALGEVCEKLRRRAPKMYAALVEIVGVLDGKLFGGEVPRGTLKADAAALAALHKKGLIVSRLAPVQDAGVESSAGGSVEFPLPELSAAQQGALDELRRELAAKDVALLFGVPSSGKSEIAFHAIAGVLAKGRDAMLMLPEISLTTQFVRRVKKVFGERVVVYHSAMGDRRRAEAYLRLARPHDATLVVGVRSSVLLPVKNLGIVVIDEEQDASYKQQSPAPRYNARDTAIVLARLHKAKTILAGATPSLETWVNGGNGHSGSTGGVKFGFVELAERFGGTLPPAVIISDTIRSAKRGERRSHFNKELTDRIGATLSRGEQVILFQNRRGVAPYIECTDCGGVPRCDHCGIPMSVHRATLQCHYCGAVRPVPSVCPSCGSPGLVTRGFGTEKIEEELARIFPEARIARLDRDSATSERAYGRIISDFEHGASDILVGTQMVTKGLDFAGVSLVGILNADNLLNHPDFRASEKAYQLIAQVAGRAGRRGARGEVVIQTASPGNRIINRAAAGDYGAMATEILAERAMYGYPPYSRLVSVMLRHPDREALHAAADSFGRMAQGEFNRTRHDPAGGKKITVLGPQPPVVEKIKGEYALVFLLKVPRARPMSEVRKMLHTLVRALPTEPSLRKTTITVDVDPQ